MMHKFSIEKGSLPSSPPVVWNQAFTSVGIDFGNIYLAFRVSFE